MHLYQRTRGNLKSHASVRLRDVGSGPVQTPIPGECEARTIGREHFGPGVLGGVHDVKAYWPMGNLSDTQIQVWSEEGTK